MMAREHHYVRFARALALVGATTAAGCYQVHEIPTDGGPVTIDDVGADAGNVGLDAEPFSCTSCNCGTVPDECFRLGHAECCGRLGPLPPPDLPT